MATTVLVILGSRPQWVKAAALSHTHKQSLEAAGINLFFLDTAQHYSQGMQQGLLPSEQFWPDALLEPGERSYDILPQWMVKGIDAYIEQLSPKMIVVLGDTISTLCGAEAAERSHIPLMHIEAGMRCGSMEVAEERIRIAADKLSQVLMAPHSYAREALTAEKLIHDPPHREVYISGDVLADSFELDAPFAQQPAQLYLNDMSFILCTLHRKELITNYPELHKTVENINQSALNLGLQVVLPLHPHTAHHLQVAKIDLPSLGWLVTAPQPRRNFLWLLKRAALVVTDSGGVQREAAYAGRRSLVLRQRTEWQDLKESGYVTECSDPLTIPGHIQNLVHLEQTEPKPESAHTGAAQFIANYLKKRFAHC